MDILPENYRSVFESGDIEQVKDLTNDWPLAWSLESFRALRNASDNDYGQTKSIEEFLRRLFFTGEAIIGSQSLPEILEIFGSSCKSLSFDSDSAVIDFSIIESLVSLEELKLSLSCCECIDGDWSKLQKLHRIEIYGPHIAKLPEIDFQNITDFKLSYSLLESLPDQFWISESLSSIGLHNNFKLSNHVEPDWPIMEELRCSGNKILPLTPLLKASSNAQTIIIGSESSKTIVLPDNDYKQLEYLEIFSSNLVEDLAINFGNTPHLTFLKCTHTGIKEIPESICLCRKLTCLDFYASPIQSIPDCIGSLSDLEELNLGNTELTSLPKDLGKLSKLAILNLPKFFKPNIEEESDDKMKLLSSLKAEITQCYISLV